MELDGGSASVEESLESEEISSKFGDPTVESLGVELWELPVDRLRFPGVGIFSAFTWLKMHILAFICLNRFFTSPE